MSAKKGTAQVARALLLFACLGIAHNSRAQGHTDVPETVMVTYHAKPGADAELARVIMRHWVTLRDLDLVEKAPHVTLRGIEDGGKTYFVDIFTWHDGRIPDAAPPAVRAIWAQMNGLVEARNGKPGLEIRIVSVVVSQDRNTR
jgi:hypothetical protein